MVMQIFRKKRPFDTELSLRFRSTSVDSGTTLMGDVVFDTCSAQVCRSGRPAEMTTGGRLCRLF
jgi:hypothetical protein